MVQWKRFLVVFILSLGLLSAAYWFGDSATTSVWRGSSPPDVALAIPAGRGRQIDINFWGPSSKLDVEISYQVAGVSRRIGTFTLPAWPVGLLVASVAGGLTLVAIDGWRRHRLAAGRRAEGVE